VALAPRRRDHFEGRSLRAAFDWFLVTFGAFFTIHRLVGGG
jgi:hypothetical protein